MKCVLGIDLGGTNVRFGIVNEKYELLDFEIFKTSELLSEGIEKFASYVDEFIKSKSDYEITLISIGFPSTINKDRTKIYSTPNIRSLQNIEIQNVFKKYCSMPLIIEKDVNLLLKYDVTDRGLGNEGIVLGFYIGTGLGNSIMIDGKFLTGEHGVAGELGHIPAFGNKKKCACGNVSCIESIASGGYIAKFVEEKYGEVGLENFFVSDELADFADGFLDNLSIALATEINIFDPSHVFIGGGVVDMKGFPKEKFVDRILKYTRKPFPANDLDIIFTNGKQSSGVIGAGIYGYERMKKNDNCTR